MSLIDAIPGVDNRIARPQSILPSVVFCWSMTEFTQPDKPFLPVLELSSLVELLFTQQRQCHTELLQQIREDIRQCQMLHQSIMESVDTQIQSHRLQLRALEDRCQIDHTLWLHPRRSRLEHELSEWHRQRLQQMRFAWEQLQHLRREYRQIWRELQQSRHTQRFLHQIADDPYPRLSSDTESEHG